MDAWGDALEADVSVTGCTVHVVTDATDDDGDVLESEVDAGPIVTQEPIPVYEGDDAESLKERVLYEGEFRAYPRAVKWFAEGAVDVDETAGEVTVEADVATVDDADHGGLPGRRIVSSDRLDTLRYGRTPPGRRGVRRLHLRGGERGPRRPTQRGREGAVVQQLQRRRRRVEPHQGVRRACGGGDQTHEPAGCATADSLSEAYEKALSTDPMSAFGGIVALNRECDADTAEGIVDSFKEVVVAPATARALEILFEKDNLRVLDVGELGERTDRFTEKPIVGGRLVQERDLQSISVDDLEIVTEREPTDEELESMVFAWQTLKHVKSNGILFADGTETVGIGMGQVSRVDAVRLAAMKADEHAEGKDAEGAVMASDAFFPFPDGIEEAAKAGIEAVVQPGGSVNDDDVIEAADEHGMAMAFTGQRSFRHD